MKKILQGKEFYIFDGFVGADADTRLPIRVITDNAWHSLFANQIFILPTQKELKNHEPEFTLLSVNDFSAIPEEEGTRTGTFIILNFKKKIILIGSTSYAGKLKKQCSPHSTTFCHSEAFFPCIVANVGKDGNSALFFGLSGTGKTTLSADPERRLLGDDEHGWGDSSIFNFEGAVTPSALI